MFKWTMAIVIVLFVFLGTAIVDAQVHATLPQFKSGASVNIGVPVDFGVLYQRVNEINDVIEHDNSHIVWKFTGTTGDLAMVFADGRVIVGSSVDFDLDAKDKLENELTDILNTLNTVGGGISDDAKTRAIDSAVYYAQEAATYHRLKYVFNSDFKFNLNVPNCTIKKARLLILGDEGIDGLVTSGQYYYLDGKSLTGCDIGFGNDLCSIPQMDITDKIPYGVHPISSSKVDQSHTMFIEAITTPTKNFVLYNDDKSVWIRETTKSLSLDDLSKLITLAIKPKNTTTTSKQLPGNILGIDPTSFPKVKVNVFVNTTCAKSASLKKEDFDVQEDGKNVTIETLYFTGNASGQKLDLAVAFDDTGSMEPQIDAMKTKVQSLVDQIKASGMNARYALVTFKDAVTIRTKWTNDSKVFKNTVNALMANGGGDEPEDSLDAIETVASMPFRDDAQKVILVITDAHAHYKGDNTTYSNYTKEDVTRDLKDKGIIFIPISPTFKSSTEAANLRDIANEIQSMWIDMNSTNFSVILDIFKQIITGTYVIEYLSPDVTSSAGRNVTVTVDKLGCAVGSISASYTMKA